MLLDPIGNAWISTHWIVEGGITKIDSYHAAVNHETRSDPLFELNVSMSNSESVRE